MSTIVQKPFSDTVKTLLIFSKRHEGDINIESVITCLAEQYHPNMKLKDLLCVLLNALNEIFQIKEFELSNKDQLFFSILTAPISGNMCLGHIVFGPNKDDKFSLEEVYNSIIFEIITVFRYTKVGWCREYLFGESK